MSTAREVIAAALIVDLPVPAGEERPLLNERAALIEAALIEHGHLPDPHQHEPTEADVEDVARWLAEQSRHPRYTVEDGWKRIMQSTMDVSVAANAAMEHARTPDAAQAVGRAEEVLGRWHARG